MSKGKINEPKITCNKQYDKKTKLTSNLNLTQRPFHNLQKNKKIKIKIDQANI